MTVADRSAGSHDVVVVGAGLAGSVAALRTASLGRRVLLVDAAADPSAAGNTALSGGSLHVGTLAMTSPEAVLRERIERVTGGLARPDLAAALAAHSGRALAWLLWNGVRVEPPTPEVSWKTVLAPVRLQDDVHGWRDKGPQVALRTLHAALIELGGEVRTSTRIRELSQAPDGRVTGVVTERGDHLEAASVVLADGGFQSNADLRRRYLGPAADRLFNRGADSGQGDALLMGEAAGAKLINMNAFYGRLLHRDAVTNDRLWPMPFLDDLLVYGILVDEHGERLLDEGRGGIAAANALAASANPLGASIVLDEEGWSAAYGRSGYSGSGGRGQPAANPEVELRGGVVHRATGPHELGRRAGIDGAGLERTIGAISAAVAAGTADRLSPPRSGPAKPLGGSFLAIPVIPAITVTMGGLLTGADARVLDRSGRPIPGLYAVGGTASGIQGGLGGGTACSYVGGLALSLVFGLLAGEDIAAEA